MSKRENTYFSFGTWQSVVWSVDVSAPPKVSVKENPKAKIASTAEQVGFRISSKLANNK